MQMAGQDGGVVAPQPLMSNDNDYRHVALAMSYLDEHWRSQPDLDTLAEHVGLSPAHFQRLFVRWAGISPKQFIQALTLDHARGMLKRGASVLDATYDVGLSGPGRLHDLFVHYEAMTPGAYKARGQGLEIAYGFHPSPFGAALIMATDRGLSGLAFADGAHEEKQAFEDMTARWPAATYVEDPAGTGQLARRIFERSDTTAGDGIKIVLMGSPFDVMVWKTLIGIPVGSAVTYGDIASNLNKPGAARAVGSAVGRNPISYVVPCHRVLRKSGALGGYHWGLARKRAIIGWEHAHSTAA